MNLFEIWDELNNLTEQMLLMIDQTNGSVDIFRQDQTTPFNDFYFIQAIGSPTTLTAQATVSSRFVDVASVASISAGDWLGIFDTSSGVNRYYWAKVIAIVGLTLELQTLIDYPFPANSYVVSTTKDMNVNGSVTPQVFEIRSGGNLAIDITRIMLACQTTAAVDLSKFGDIAGGLTYGMYLRAKENGTFRNKLIIRSNFDFAKFAYDWTPFAAANPIQGQDGFNWRFTLNGDDKHGVVNRAIGTVNTLQWVIQDDLTSLELLQAVGANHEVED